MRSVTKKLLQFDGGMPDWIKILIKIIASHSHHPSLVNSSSSSSFQRNPGHGIWQWPTTPLSTLLSVKCWWQGVTSTIGVTVGLQGSRACQTHAYCSSVSSISITEGSGTVWIIKWLLYSVFIVPVYLHSSCQVCTSHNKELCSTNPINCRSSIFFLGLILWSYFHQEWPVCRAYGSQWSPGASQLYKERLRWTKCSTTFCHPNWGSRYLTICSVVSPNSFAVTVNY